MVGCPSNTNSSSRTPRLLWLAWIVRALVTSELEPGTGIHPSSSSYR
jgi:hypothetical protein